MDGDERRRALAELSEQWVATTDGRQLRAVVAGTGTDLVVLEAGLGAAALTWGPVMEHLAPHCRVVAYDRAGYGRSDPGPGPRDLRSEEHTSELQSRGHLVCRLLLEKKKEVV